MSKWFLVTRIAILAALLFVAAAALWGWTHQTRPSSDVNSVHLEKYNAKKPGAGTTAFFVISVFAGILIVSFSIWLEWDRAGERGGPRKNVWSPGGRAEESSTGLGDKDVTASGPRARGDGFGGGMATPEYLQPRVAPDIAAGSGQPAGEGVEGAGGESGAKARGGISGDEPQ